MINEKDLDRFEKTVRSLVELSMVIGEREKQKEGEKE
jgi:hypothetical protein